MSTTAQLTLSMFTLAQHTYVCVALLSSYTYVYPSTAHISMSTTAQLTQVCLP